MKSMIALVVLLAAAPLRAATMAIGQTDQQVHWNTPQSVTISGSVSASVNGSTVAIVNAQGQNLNVAVAAALPAGSNVIGALVANQSVNISQYGGSTTSLGQKTMANSMPVAFASDQTALGPLALATVNKSSQSVTTSSVQMFSSNSSRKGLELVSLCSNTDFVTCSWSGSALSTDTVFLNPCSSYQPPPGIIPTNALSCVSNSGTQVVRGTEYATP